MQTRSIIPAAQPGFNGDRLLQWRDSSQHIVRPSDDRNGSLRRYSPRPTTPVKRADPGHEVEVYEGSFEAGVLYHRARPSIRRVAVATPRRETRETMTSKTIGSK